MPDKQNRLCVLPDEILLNIFSNLLVFQEAETSDADRRLSAAYVYPSNIHTLTVICRTCSHLRRVVQPLLFQTIVDPGLGRHVQQTLSDPPAVTQQLDRPRLLLDTLVKRRDLAERIQVLNLSHLRAASPIQQDRLEPSGTAAKRREDIAHLLCTPCSHTRKCDRNSFLKIPPSNLDADLGLVLYLSKNVRRLSFDLTGTFSICLDTVLAATLNPRVSCSTWATHYRNLVSMTINHQPDSEKRDNLGGQVGSLCFIFQLRSLKNLEMDACPSLYSANHWTCPPARSTITKLRLTSFNGGPDLLSRMIKSCAALSVLELTTELPDWRRLLYMLEPHRPHLTHLNVDCPRYSTPRYWHIGPFYSYNPLGCTALRTFARLEYLQIQQLVLTGNRLLHGPEIPAFLPAILPPSLTSFALMDVCDPNLLLLDGLRRQLPSCCPKLVKIVRTRTPAFELGRLSPDTLIDGVLYKTSRLFGEGEGVGVREVGGLGLSDEGVEVGFAELGVSVELSQRLRKGDGNAKVVKEDRDEREGGDEWVDVDDGEEEEVRMAVI